MILNISQVCYPQINLCCGCLHLHIVKKICFFSLVTRSAVAIFWLFYDVRMVQVIQKSRLFFWESCYVTPALQRLILITFSLEKGGNVRSKKRYVISFFCKYFPTEFLKTTCSRLVFKIFLLSFFDISSHYENILELIVLSLLDHAISVLPM